MFIWGGNVLIILCSLSLSLFSFVFHTTDPIVRSVQTSDLVLPVCSLRRLWWAVVRREMKRVIRVGQGKIISMWFQVFVFCVCPRIAGGCNSSVLSITMNVQGGRIAWATMLKVWLVSRGSRWCSSSIIQPRGNNSVVFSAVCTSY